MQVENKRLELLQHPVVFDVLKSRWHGLGFLLYLSQLLAYLTFIIPLSVLVLTVKQPAEPICSKLANVNFIVDTLGPAKDFHSRFEKAWGKWLDS